MKRVASVAGAGPVSIGILVGVLVGALGEGHLKLMAPAKPGSAASEVLGGVGHRDALDALAESLHEVVLGPSGVLRVGHSTVMVVLSGRDERHREV